MHPKFPFFRTSSPPGITYFAPGLEPACPQSSARPLKASWFSHLWSPRSSIHPGARRIRFKRPVHFILSKHFTPNPNEYAECLYLSMSLDDDCRVAHLILPASTEVILLQLRADIN